MGSRFADLPHFPAAMPLSMAAGYCGLSPETFKLRCPVKPIKLGASTRGDRYLRQRLDEWLFSLDRNPPPKAARRSMGELLGGQGAPARP